MGWEDRGRHQGKTGEKVQYKLLLEQGLPLTQEGVTCASLSTCGPHSTCPFIQGWAQGAEPEDVNQGNGLGKRFAFEFGINTKETELTKRHVVTPRETHTSPCQAPALPR